MPSNASTIIVTFLLGWMVALSLGVVVYLARLTIQEWRRNRRMAEQRARLGLRHA